jgi:hypothetical protein
MEEYVMDNANRPAGRSGGTNGFLLFVVGALVVAVGVLGYMFMTGSLGQTREEAAIERSADAIGDAARDITDTVEDAAERAPPPSQPVE